MNGLRYKRYCFLISMSYGDSPGYMEQIFKLSNLHELD